MGYIPVSVVLENLHAVNPNKEDLSDVRTRAKRTALANGYNEEQTREVILAADRALQKALNRNDQTPTAKITVVGNTVSVLGTMSTQDLLVAGGLAAQDITVTGNLTVNGNSVQGGGSGGGTSADLSYLQYDAGAQSLNILASLQNTTIAGTLTCTGATNGCSALVVGPLVTIDEYGSTAGSINMTNYGDMSCVGGITSGGFNIVPGLGYADGSVDFRRATSTKLGTTNITGSLAVDAGVNVSGGNLDINGGNINAAGLTCTGALNGCSALVVGPLVTIDEYGSTAGSINMTNYGDMSCVGGITSGGLNIVPGLGYADGSVDFRRATAIRLGKTDITGDLNVSGNARKPRGLYGVVQMAIAAGETKTLNMQSKADAPALAFDGSNGNMFTVQLEGMYTLAFDHIKSNDYGTFANLPWSLVHTNYLYGSPVTSPMQYGTTGLSRFFHAGDSFYIQVINQSDHTCELYSGDDGTNMMISYVLPPV